jgi:excisionase family DNA binding protein
MSTGKGLAPSVLLSTAAVAKWFGVSARTICFWAECGEIPALKIGRQWRFREEDLNKWLDGEQTRIMPFQVAKRKVS